MEHLKALADTKYWPFYFVVVFLPLAVLKYAFSSFIVSSLVSFLVHQRSGTTSEIDPVDLGQQSGEVFLWYIEPNRYGISSGIVHEVHVMFPNEVFISEFFSKHFFVPNLHGKNSHYGLILLEFWGIEQLLVMVKEFELLAKEVFGLEGTSAGSYLVVVS